MRGAGGYLLYGTLAWLPMPVIAVGNAGLRELVLQPAFGAAAQPLSGLTLVASLAIYAFVMVRRLIGGATAWASWLLGLIWGALTLGFEYALIASASAQPLDCLIETLSPAAIADGNLFALAVLVVLLTPPFLTRSD